jgi:hemerythrin-like metal-binding protein
LTVGTHALGWEIGMPLVEWQTKFETRIPDVDHEHRKLIQQINALHDGLSAEPDADAGRRFFGDLYAAISAHFALEEAVMRSHRYDEYGDHKADHERLLEEIRDIMDDFEADPTGNYSGALADRLKTWFVGHFQNRDARLHRLLRGSFDSR